MADYLTDEEQAERLKRWWDSNGTFLIIGLILMVAVIIGVRVYRDYNQDRAEAASALFSAYLDARTTAAPVDDYLAAIDAQYPGTTYHVFTLLYRAADRVEQQDWEGALALLERAVELASTEILRDTARYRAAKVFYQLDRLDECEALLALISSAGLEPHVAELSGDIFVVRGDLAAARAAYRAALDAARRDPEEIVPGVSFLELKLASLVDAEQ